jgi:flagellar hook-associated protein 2
LLNAEKGSFTTTSDRLTAEAKSLAKEREKMESTADAYEARLKASFTAMETRVTAMKATQAYLQQQIDMWTNADD